MNDDIPSFKRTAVTAVLIGLAFIGTMALRLPIPATNGYFNLGDMFVILAGIWLGPWRGLLVGAIGPAAADAIGFPQFILATAVTKGLEGLAAGAIAKSVREQRIGHSLAAGITGGVVMVAGYFVFEAVIYPWLGTSIAFFNVTTLGAAIVELGPNSIQAVIGCAGGLALWRMLTGGQQTRTRRRAEN
ncbi:MAG TPA: ECF transporter S component [Allosphingosinicella sp.]|nr:ECF transporter S component [Allosphingosinicella sp.]